jgi:hypothetical protein
MHAFDQLFGAEWLIKYPRLCKAPRQARAAVAGHEQERTFVPRKRGCNGVDRLAGEVAVKECSVELVGIDAIDSLIARRDCTANLSARVFEHGNHVKGQQRFILDNQNALPKQLSCFHVGSPQLHIAFCPFVGMSVRSLARAKAFQRQSNFPSQAVFVDRHTCVTTFALCALFDQNGSKTPATGGYDGRAAQFGPNNLQVGAIYLPTNGTDPLPVEREPYLQQLVASSCIMSATCSAASALRVMLGPCRLTFVSSIGPCKTCSRMRRARSAPCQVVALSKSWARQRLDAAREAGNELRWFLRPPQSLLGDCLYRCQGVLHPVV